MKKIIALITAAIMVLNAFILGAFKAEAAFVPASAPVVEELIEALLTALGAGTAETLGNMSLSSKISALESHLNNSGKDEKSAFLDALFFGTGTYADKALLETLNKPTVKAAVDVLRASPRAWLNYLSSDYDVLSDDYLESTFDMEGYGACVTQLESNGSISQYRVYCGYAVINLDESVSAYDGVMVQYYGGSRRYFSSYGGLFFNANRICFGDVRYGSEDGEKVPTKSTVPDLDYTIGVLPDGTEVSIEDLLNTKDGTINGEDVQLDWDSFTDTALDDLIGDIIDQMEEAERLRDDFEKEIDKAVDDYYNEELTQQIAEITPENVSDVRNAVQEVALSIPLFGDVTSYLPRLLKLFTPDSDPNDIEITISLKPLADFEKTYTLVKYSWFKGGNFSEMLLFVRRFSTVLIGIFLLLKIFKRVVGFFGGVSDYKYNNDID